MQRLFGYKARKYFESFSTENNSMFPMENILKALLACIQIDVVYNMPTLDLVCFWIKQVLYVLIIYILCCHVVLLASILESGRVRSPLDEELILKVKA